MADVAHRPQIAIGQSFEVANKIGAPVSASDHTHNDWIFHITANSSALKLPPLADFRSFRKSQSASLLLLLQSHN